MEYTPGKKSLKFNDTYEGNNLDKIAYPIGGFGTGMFCLGGTGSFSHFSLRCSAQLINEWATFSALALKTKDGFISRVLEGPVPRWKPVFAWNRTGNGAGSGSTGRSFGLPRFNEARFSARFPFARIELSDDKIPLDVVIVGWSPFVPSDADASSLPVGSVEYRFKNTSAEPVEFVYSFHSENFLAEGPGKHFLGQQVEKSGSSVAGIPGGFLLRQPALPDMPTAEASFAAFLEDKGTQADLAWFRGGWFDALTILWKDISTGRTGGRGPVNDEKPSAGGSLYLPINLAPGEEKTVRLLLAWYAPYSTIRCSYPEAVKGKPLDPKSDFYRAWYTSHFPDIESVATHWKKNHAALRRATDAFTNSFYDSTLPPEVVEAVSANLPILKSPTVLREKGGTLWGWEGSNEEGGSCHGSCTHVWNYAQALPHLFPKLERGLREVEFNLSQDEQGHQAFRASLPLGPAPHDFHAAADGQLGGITKVYREWRISGDTEWLKSLWPKVRKSLDYCIQTWDPERRGVPVEPHHNTYDIEFWGPDGMCASFYLAALQAAVAMGRALGDDVSSYQELLVLGKAFVEKELFNGEYFIQKVQWTGLRAADPIEGSKKGIRMDYSPEAKELLEKEGPKYQYGEGCLSDGVLGEWLAWASGLAPILEPGKVESHLRAVRRHNFRADLSEHANPQRPGYAFGHDAGLLLCTWPRGGRLSLPFVYSEEVWTGIEYQVASHLISAGRVEEGLEIVRACRQRYDGDTRNPFDEFECGHWYARAMASYALLQALTGARYDAIDKILTLRPRIAGDFRSFLAVDGGYGTVGVKDGKPFFDVKAGSVEIRKIEYIPWTASVDR